MDNEILAQLKNISMQLEKITNLLEKKKSFPPRRDSFPGRNPFSKSDGRDFDRKPHFNADRKPRVAAGRNFSFKNKKRNRF
ncbi:MAG: hypothetical protein FWG57_09225 [Endomicrobia bacterium]|nr:hypothetical protein [Endomicrobiia bacterium]